MAPAPARPSSVATARCVRDRRNPPIRRRSSVTDTHSAFIFHEASGRRWRRLRRGAQFAAVVLTVALLLALLSVVRKPELPPVTVTIGNYLPHMPKARPLLHPTTNLQTRDASPGIFDRPARAA